MLAKKYKLTGKKNLEQLFKQGRYQETEFLRLKWIKNQLEFNRFVFAIGIKVSKKAVQRNKIKRKLEEIIRNYKDLKQGYDLAIIAKPEILNKNYQTIKKDLLDLIKKANLIINKEQK